MFLSIYKLYQVFCEYYSSFLIFTVVCGTLTGLTTCSHASTYPTIVNVNVQQQGKINCFSSHYLESLVTLSSSLHGCTTTAAIDVLCGAAFPA